MNARPRRVAGTLHYATQVSSGPPSFVIFGGSRAPDPSYQRYIENRLRRSFDLDGVPDPAAVPPAGEEGPQLGATVDRFEMDRHGAAGPAQVPTVVRPVHSPSSGRGAAWLARLSGGQKVAGSNPAGPTDEGNGGVGTGIVRDPHRPQPALRRCGSP